jgi:putative ABC transport system ATP-binding protein
MSALIHLENAAKVYKMRGGDVHALKGITLDIDSGEFVSIVGTSGCGKSTLLYVLGALIETTGGAYQFDGASVEDMTDINRATLRGQDIGFVFQSFHLVPQLSVVKNVMMAARYCTPSNGRAMSRRQLKKRAMELIDRVGLSERRRHRPIELSNGQMQRVAIARALLNKPRVLLADEPTGNLDIKTRDEIFETLKEFNAEGTTIVMVTHDPELAERTPRQIRLSDGEVVQ